MFTNLISSYQRIRDFIPPSPTSAYRVRLAENLKDVNAAQKLRFRIFNEELGEGLKASEATGLDQDRFDEVCDHLLIEHVNDQSIVGTYRLQTGENAKANFGYYSEQEFCFEPFEGIRSKTVELGRACISKEHRNMVVLGLLWKGIAQYTKVYGARYLIGCSSLTSTDPVEGIAAYEKLKDCLVEDRFQTEPTDRFRITMTDSDRIRLPEACRSVAIPRLMRSYLTLGSKVCSPPALDREFKTIDFLTFLDLQNLAPRALKKLLG
ncbi:GNAT family N-acetyltransferase [Puniceicoccaceae bacterium K14]|nr:GNAT family N-acetyltransferase [Puniceicoccaceae bacterium K14]